MIVMPYKEAQEMANSHVCGECGGQLVTPWGQKEFGISAHVLVCGTDRSHQGIAKPGRVPIDAQPSYIRDNIERKERKRMEEEFGEDTMTAVDQYRGSTSLTQKQAVFILRKCWPVAPDEAVLRGAMICAQYGLNPLMRHLYLVEFKGKWVPILGIDATRLIASRAAKKRGLTGYGFVDGPRMMRPEEQREIFGEVFEDRFMAIVKIKDSDGNMAPGYGSWPNGDEPYGREKGNTRQNMAFIRAERNSLARLLPGEMPEDIDVADLSFVGGLVDGPKRLESPPTNKGKAKPKAEVKTRAEAASDAAQKAAISDVYGPDPVPPKTLEVMVGKIRMALKILGQDELSDAFTQYIRTRFGTGMLDELTLDQASTLLDTLSKRVAEKGEN